MISFIVALVITGLVAWFLYKSMKPVEKAASADNYVDKEIILSVNEDSFLRTEKKKKKSS